YEVLALFLYFPLSLIFLVVELGVLIDLVDENQKGTEGDEEILFACCYMFYFVMVISHVSSGLIVPKLALKMLIFLIIHLPLSKFTAIMLIRIPEQVTIAAFIPLVPNVVFDDPNANDYPLSSGSLETLL
ncbi:hypothetical protein ACJX0J_014965, partial [Zea mays]